MASVIMSFGFIVSYKILLSNKVLNQRQKKIYISVKSSEILYTYFQTATNTLHRHASTPGVGNTSSCVYLIRERVT